jgi:uncharacterized protein (TIGR02611 family)
MPAADADTLRPHRRAVRTAQAAVAKAKSTRTGRLVWRVVVTLIGVAIIAVGIVLLPLPGPGWLIIFAGLGVLSTEYEWAKRLLRFARDQVGRWTDWVVRQSRLVQGFVALLGLVFLGAVSVGVWYLYG